MSIILPQYYNHPRGWTYFAALYQNYIHYTTHAGKMPLKDLNFISGNPKKLSEIRAILGDIIEVKSTPADLSEIQGSSADIVSDKCRRACDIVRSVASWLQCHRANISNFSI